MEPHTDFPGPHTGSHPGLGDAVRMRVQRDDRAAPLWQAEPAQERVREFHAMSAHGVEVQRREVRQRHRRTGLSQPDWRQVKPAGTIAETSPPNWAISLTRLELT